MGDTSQKETTNLVVPSMADKTEKVTIRGLKPTYARTALEDEESFYNYLRMEAAMFDELLQRVGPRFAKQNTNWKACLEPGLKLSGTLRFLATVDKYPTLQYQYRVSHSIISIFVPEVCRAIQEEYKNEDA